MVEEGETFRWAGVYGYDLNDRETIETQAQRLRDFPARASRSGWPTSEFVFLANIDPELQLSVLDQVTAPKLVACDTMNFWIEGKRDALVELMRRVDIMVMNDSECRELADEPNLIKAARMVLDMGPKTVVVKKGEHGALHGRPRLRSSAPRRSRARTSSTPPARATPSPEVSWATWRRRETSRRQASAGR